MRRNEPALSEYQPLVQKLLDVLGPMMAAGSAPEQIAEVIYTAVTDGSDQFRDHAGVAAAEMLDDRRAMDDATFMTSMRAQVGLTQAMPEGYPSR